MIFFNRYFDKNRLKALILWSLTKSGEKTTIDLVEKLKDLGFSYATQAGLSLGIDDLKIPPTKAKLILDAEITVQSSQKDFEIGNVTVVEKFQQLIDSWHRTSEILKQNVVEHFRSTDILNPVYMMAFSGARGNISQVRQLVGMRGLMADPQGQILDFPIRSNFREGLTLTEYVISCYGARKGLVDTALRTANSGYLTRRLIDVAQHIIVRQLDCGTTNGILITDMKDGNKVIFSLQKRLIGRVLAESIENTAKRNQDISPALSLKIVKLTNQVLVRSPLSCEAKNSICQLCYGWSLAHGNLVSLGEAVGILAAQSIGEPGTQLTMRTFHTGGVFSGDVMQEIRSPFDGIVEFSNPLQGVLIRTLHGKIAFLTKTEGELRVFNQTNSQLVKYNIPTSTVLFIRQLESVKERQLLAEYSSVVTTGNQGIQAKYNVNSTIEGQIYFENVLLVVKGGKEGDFIKTALKFGSIWILSGKLYQSAIRSKLFIKPNDFVDKNSILNESILITPYSGFLTKKTTKKTSSKFLNKTLTPTNKSSFPLAFKKQNSQDNLCLNQNFLEINFQKIHYKKFGYFLSLNDSTKNQIFLKTSLNQKDLSFKELSLEWFSDNNVSGNSLTFFDTNFFSEQNGQFFKIDKTVYQITQRNLFDASFLNGSQLVQKNQKLFVLKNKQGYKLPITAKKTGVIEKIQTLPPKKELSKELKSKSTKIFYKKNPALTVFNCSKKFLKFEQKNQYECSPPICLKLNNKKIRKANFKNPIFLSLINLVKLSKEKNLASPKNFLKHKSNEVKIEPKDKNKIINLAIQSGWIFIPKQFSQLFFVTKSVISPTSKTTFYNFDQSYISLKIVSGTNLIFLFAKTNHLNKCRYINNKFFRYNKVHQYKQTFPISQNITEQTNSVIFLKNQKQIKLSVSLPSLYSTSKLIRNKLYLKNLKSEILDLIQILKPSEIRILNNQEQKHIFQKNLNKSNNFKFIDVQSFGFNKQNITKLRNPSSSIDPKINQPDFSLKLKDQQFQSQSIQITFRNPENFFVKKAQLKIQFGQQLNFYISRNVQSINSLFNEKNKTLTNRSKVLITKNRRVSEQNTFSINSFFSPLQGEITTIKTNLIGKEKSLLLTNNDKISFSNKQNESLVKIGQLLRYGDQIFKKTASTESGQIIQIDKDKITLRKAQPILFSSQGVFHVDNGDIIEKNSPLITLFYQKLKTEDIVQGIPKIEELFEARQTKEGETLQENLHTKLNIFFNLFKQQYTSQEATRKSIEKIQQILVNNVQKVYQSQGVSIADKHIEIIVRQMTTKVKITESGRTGLLRGELIDLEWVEIINLGIEAQNELTEQGIEVEKAEYEPIILGITKAALETESFISASSFQETTRILSRAAIERKTDFLRGLKENVILGHLIPAGTGFSLSFDSQIKVSNNLNKICWLSYKDVITKFSKQST